MRMKDKIGIVTAAASGMGRAGAVRFAKEGAAVGVVDIDRAGVEAVVAEIKAAGGRALPIVADLTNDEESRRIVRETAKAFGGLDFVWNHVGHPGPAAVEGIDMRDYDLAMTLNLRTVLITTQTALPELRARGGGALLFTASTSGLAGSQFSPVYSMAKHGVVGFVRALAKRPGHVEIVDRTAERRVLKAGQLLATAAALSRHLRKTVPENRVGLVLPPGIGATVANLAVLCAGKTPVNLNFTKVTGAGLEHLKGLSQLASLALNDTQVTDAGLEHLKRLSQLRTLNLVGTLVSSAGLEHLKGLPQLQCLYLGETKVTDAGLEHLQGLSQLRVLYLGATRCTPEGKSKLQQALPKCRIE
jgi:NADP-dependent 3-hydroxy acid dehydrogenase YdfG